MKSLYRGHPGLNRGPLDLQSNALPLSYTPVMFSPTVRWIGNNRGMGPVLGSMTSTIFFM